MTSNATERLGTVLVLGLGRTGESVARYAASLVPSRVDSVTLYGGASSQETDATRELAHELLVFNREHVSEKVLKVQERDPLPAIRSFRYQHR